MSSLPGVNLEDYLAWQWNLSVIDQPESNVSVAIAEVLGFIKPRTSLTKEQVAPLMALYEPYREVIEERLLDFDEETQSWRAYADYVGCDVPEEVTSNAEKIVAELLKPTR